MTQPADSLLTTQMGVSKVMSTLLFGGCISAVVVLVGTRDLESYLHAFFSLDRGTAVDSVQVLGQPVYTLALGLGVRLPLHGSLGASPAAALAPYVPAPVTYWLLLTFAIAAAVLLVRLALEPLCGARISWLAAVLLFSSAPLVNYTITDDWPDSAATYCAFIGFVFAPHASLTLLGSQTPARIRGWAMGALSGVVFGLVALSHSGYWGLLAATLIFSAILALYRPDQPTRRVLLAVAVLGAVSLLAVLPQIPDIVRELTAGGTIDGRGMKRYVQGPEGSLVTANLFPLGPIDPRAPFTCLLLALVSLAIGLTSDDARIRRLTSSSALVSIVLGIGASTLSPGSSIYAPSATWFLRDPAGAFAVLSAAYAAAEIRRRRGIERRLTARALIAVFVVAALQGPAYAATVVVAGFPGPSSIPPWNQDMTAPERRVVMRGLVPDRVPPGGRLALWPATEDKMRNGRRATSDFADAGYLLVTATTKQRTMRGLIEPNELLFNQAVELSARILCDEDAVRFLQLRYLLLPSDTSSCGPWMPVPGVLIDGWLDVAVATAHDDLVRALPVARLKDPAARQPALSAGSELLSGLAALPGTSVRVAPPEVVIRLGDVSRARGLALVLPLAYDTALQASSGEVHNVGGLAALTDVADGHVIVRFVPDLAALMKAGAMTLAQVLTLAGFLGFAYVPSASRRRLMSQAR